MKYMIRQKCKIKFHKMYLEAVKVARTEEELDSLHKFMQEANRYAISQIPPIFVGLGVSDSQNEMANNLIKNVLPYETTYANVAYRVLIFAEERNLLTQTVLRETCTMEDVISTN